MLWFSEKQPGIQRGEMSLSSHNELGWVWIEGLHNVLRRTHWESQIPCLSKVLCFYNHQSRMLACPESILTFSHRGGFCELLSLFLWDARLTGTHFLFTDELLITCTQFLHSTSVSLLLWWQTVFALPYYSDSWLGLELGTSPQLQSLRTLSFSVVFLANLSPKCRWDPGNLLSVPSTMLDVGRDKRPRKLY